MIEPAKAAFEERAALLLAVRQAGVRDISVMRAIEAVPREAFAPYKFRDLANRNMALPLGCGQTMSRPADLGRRIEALRIGRGHRVLEVGTGSGYGTAILARLAREVVSLERYETLAIEAARRLAALPAANAAALHGDGLAPAPTLGQFDRIVVQAALDAPPAALLQLLSPGGALVYARRDFAEGEKRPRQRLIKVDRIEGGDLRENDLGPHSLGAAAFGVAKAL
ncbi:protein-L-isoaspartate O-methyltransferase family protein [Methylocystis parvus]|uniref:Protein-L-isoaspartate O-methyltransferase n=1 Tax=Methylocystis parvus TaxID=134 RepID=A0A6B8M9F3_9HYPH|nr:protein-L-isoaspartate O-methyltransferase [Methylocystis parvus]QGM99296.1 protein-L-isoaspartate(D-aspartate) O-methyltransferase [Methylocystis parvus]WBK00314.1 protein-L-isoaspartate(D-aspartate) O-methyltransferase [Methylocystis parvus OBBP]